MESRGLNKELGGKSDKKDNSKAFKPLMSLYKEFQELSKPVIIKL